MAPPLTPMRSPIPSHLLRRKSNVGGRSRRRSVVSTAAAPTAAASSGEKETPTVVFTETASPVPNGESGGKTISTVGVGAGGNCMLVARRSTTIVAVRPSTMTENGSSSQPEVLFESSQNSTSSSPGSRAAQSLVDESDNDGDDVFASYSHDNGDDDDDGSGEFATTEKDDDCDDEEEGILSEDSDEAAKQYRQVVSMIQNVLDMGIASICRLRGLFPQVFFQKYDFDFDGTTITKFNEEAIQRIVDNADGNGSCRDSDDDAEDETSMVKSFQARTQRSLSPLTEISQKYHGSIRGDNNDDRPAYSDREKHFAMEALLLLKWMQNDGVGEILREGNLARIVFGICVPSDETGGTVDSKDELVESYSFNISYNQPENPTEVDRTQVIEGTGTFFQNLNGFQAGCRSLSQSVVPCKTQSSCFSQASRASSRYDARTRKGHFSLSQKHQDCSQLSQSQMDMSQKSLMQSMSQSIRVSVKKNRGRKIPTTRYLTLRVDFTKQVTPDELPPGLKHGGYESTTASGILTSPVPITGGNDGVKGTNNGFVVTPLGRIAETGYTGLCVDMVAETRTTENDRQDDEQSVRFTRQSSPSPSLSQRHPPLTQPAEEDLIIEEPAIDDIAEDEHDYCPLTQPAEKDCQASKDETRIEAQGSQEKAEVKENAEVRVGSKAFAVPYGGKCEGQTYILCDVRDHRITKSYLNGQEREEFKCAFYSNELEAMGRKKQWVSSKLICGYRSMVRNIDETLRCLLKEQRGGVTRSIFEEVAREVGVDSKLVEKIAKKRKKALPFLQNKRVKKSRANVYD